MRCIVRWLGLLQADKADTNQHEKLPHARMIYSVSRIALCVSTYLLTSFIFIPLATAAEFIYEYQYGGQAYSTLGEAEEAMRSSGVTGSDRLVLYDKKAENNSGDLVYKYHIPNFPGEQIAPTFYFSDAPSGCKPETVSCGSEAESKQKHIDYFFSLWATVCDVTLTEQGDWSPLHSWASGGGSPYTLHKNQTKYYDEDVVHYSADGGCSKHSVPP